MNSKKIYESFCKHTLYFFNHADYNKIYEHSIDNLVECLNEPKNQGMEDIYWQLAGSGDPGETSQLLLISMMIDHYDIIRQEGKVEITLYKKWI